MAATPAGLQGGGSRQAITRRSREASEAASGRPDAVDGVFAPHTSARYGPFHGVGTWRPAQSPADRPMWIRSTDGQVEPRDRLGGLLREYQPRRVTR